MLSRLFRRRRLSKVSIANSRIERLESRTLFSAVESASAQLQLLSTTGAVTNPIYNYGITLTNTGTTNLGTFWLGWVPGEDFLPSVPTSPTSPAGWGNAAGTSSTPAITGRMNSFDGSAIQWVAQSAGAALTPGNSLAGFDFTTTDSPLALDGDSPQHPPTPVLTSFVYGGAPLSDSGFQFVVTGITGVSAAPSATALAASAPTGAAGSSVTLTATVMPVSPGVTPTGTVTFTQGGASLGAATLQPNGTATFSTSVLPLGVDSITATYDGDANYTASVSPAITETITPAPLASSTTLVASEPQVAVGAPVTFTATVAPASGAGAIPTGTITFLDGGATLGSVAVSNDGTAVFSTSSLSQGAHGITATYSGDSSYLTSAASAITETVTAPAVTPPVVTPPTLAPTIIKSTLSPAIVSGSKTHGVVVINISNETAATIKGKTTVDLYATTDGAIDASSTVVGSTERTVNLKASKSVKVSLRVTSALAGLSAGTYTLLARTIDPSPHTTDATTGPTVMVAAPFISLAETFSKLTLPAIVTAGAKTRGTATLLITNGGNIQSAGATMISLYASPDGLVDGTATLIQTAPKSLRINPGKSIALSLPIKMFPAVTAGSYSIVAQVIDPKRQTTFAVTTMKVSVY